MLEVFSFEGVEKEFFEVFVFSFFVFKSCLKYKVSVVVASFVVFFISFVVEEFFFCFLDKEVVVSEFFRVE